MALPSSAPQRQMKSVPVDTILATVVWFLEFDPNGIHYKGKLINGKREGRGVQHDESGKMIFYGIWKAGAPLEGSMYYKDGSYYKGTFSNNLSGHAEGIGVLNFHDGAICKGDWKDGTPHGHITVMRADGSKRYEGKCANGRYEGEGTYFNPNGTKYYEGGWMRGGKCGSMGIQYYEDGAKHMTGVFVNNTCTGNGTYYFKNGDYCSGTIVNNFLEEQGVLYNSLGIKRYDGQWHNGRIHGRGTEFNIDGTIKYEGVFINGCKSSAPKAAVPKRRREYLFEQERSIKIQINEDRSPIFTKSGC